MAQVYYIIYRVEQNGDLFNCFESVKREKVADWLGINKKHLNRYFIKDIDNLDKKLKDNQYFIFKDKGDN